MAVKSTVIQKKIIHKKDLPLSCPLPDESLWNQHPRVYIPLNDEGHGSCPYCGNQFALETPANDTSI